MSGRVGDCTRIIPASLYAAFQLERIITGNRLAWKNKTDLGFENEQKINKFFFFLAMV